MHLAAALHDPDPAVVAAALRCPDLPAELVAERLWTAPAVLRGRLYAWLRRHADPSLAERVLEQVRELRGDVEAAGLLPACSPAAVRRLLPELGYAVTGWSAFLLRRPEAVLEHAAAELDALGPEARAVWWARSSRLVGALARHRPGALLELWERGAPGGLPLPLRAALTRLLGVDAARVVRLLLADREASRSLTGWRAGGRARQRLAALPDADLGDLLRASGPDPGLLLRVLRAVPPARRAAVFDLAHAGRDLSAVLLDEDVLLLLPAARRQREAERMLALPALAEEPVQRWRVTAVLPWSLARPVLLEALGAADADERAAGYAALAGCAGRSGDPAVVADLLGVLARLRNERDPVRSRALAALVAGVRPALYPASAEAALDALVRGAMDAPDCSWQTRRSVHDLVFGVLAYSAAEQGGQPLLGWALDTVERLAGWQGAEPIGGRWQLLPRGREREVLRRLQPYLEANLDRGRAGPLLAVARALGRRGWVLPDVQELLRRASEVSDDGVVRAAVELWLQPPAGRAERAAELVARDPSLVTLPPVLAVVAGRRPDVVDAVLLAGRPLRGRFGTGRARWVPVLAPVLVARWTPARIRRYVAVLELGIGDPKLARVERARLVQLLAGLPGTLPADVARFVDGGDALVAEAALAGLGRGGDPAAALPVLLGHAHGELARTAVPAVAGCLRRLPPQRAARPCIDLLATGPTLQARKEAALLLAAARPEGALDALLAAWDTPGVHRDLRAAVAQALQSWAGEERVGAVLEAAAAGEREVAATLLRPGPYRFAPRHRRFRAELVTRLAGHPDPQLRRAALAALAEWAPWAPDARATLVAQLADLGAGQTWRSAAAAALTPAVWTGTPGLLPEAVAALLAVTGADPDAQPLRDLPARRRVEHLVAGLGARPAVARRNPGPVRALVQLLAERPSFVPAAARLAATLAWPGPQFADRLLGLADLLRDRPIAAVGIGRTLGRSGWDPAEAAAGLDALAERGGLAGGLLAVHVTAELGPAAGWSSPWRVRVRRLRRHPEQEVADAALAVATVEE